MYRFAFVGLFLLLVFLAQPTRSAPPLAIQETPLSGTIGPRGYLPIVLEGHSNGQSIVTATNSPPTLTLLPTTTPSPTSTPTPTQRSQDFDRNGDGKVTCADFSTQAEARVALLAGYDNLDADHDGIPCESLPP